MARMRWLAGMWLVAGALEFRRGRARRRCCTISCRRRKGQPESGVIGDAAGNLYGTAYGGGAYNAGVVYEIDPAGLETVLYNFTGGDDGGDTPKWSDLRFFRQLIWDYFQGRPLERGRCFHAESGGTKDGAALSRAGRTGPFREGRWSGIRRAISTARPLSEAREMRVSCSCSIRPDMRRCYIVSPAGLAGAALPRRRSGLRGQPVRDD